MGRKDSSLPTNTKKYLVHFPCLVSVCTGLYIISPKIFDYLEENITNNIRSGAGFGFTPALDRLRDEEGLLGLIVEGQRYDIGSPDSYLNTLIAFNNAGSSRPSTPMDAVSPTRA